MKIAVLSGKGGAGKTMVAVNLAVAAGHAAYLDCDVEEPNGRLFLKPQEVREEAVCTPVPSFDPHLCDGCRACVSFCRFHALVYLKDGPRVFPEICHGCGGCGLVCPKGAIRETARPVGVLEDGHRGGVRVITGVLNVGEASGVPVIRAVLARGREIQGLTVVDCPPGSACPVVESCSQADYCLLVAEPTAFGLHNFRMVHRLTRVLGKPCGVVINKMEAPYGPLEQYCRDERLPVLLRIPYRKSLARICAQGGIAVEQDDALRDAFGRLLLEIGGGNL